MDRNLLYDLDVVPVGYLVASEVAQGSVLDLLFWNVMYDHLLHMKLPRQVTLTGYADDTAIVAVD